MNCTGTINIFFTSFMAGWQAQGAGTKGAHQSHAAGSSHKSNPFVGITRIRLLGYVLSAALSGRPVPAPPCECKDSANERKTSGLVRKSFPGRSLILFKDSANERTRGTAAGERPCPRAGHAAKKLLLNIRPCPPSAANSRTRPSPHRASSVRRAADALQAAG